MKSRLTASAEGAVSISLGAAATGLLAEALSVGVGAGLPSAFGTTGDGLDGAFGSPAAVAGVKAIFVG